MSAPDPRLPPSSREVLLGEVMRRGRRLRVERRTFVALIAGAAVLLLIAVPLAISRDSDSEQVATVNTPTTDVRAPAQTTTTTELTSPTVTSNTLAPLNTPLVPENLRTPTTRSASPKPTSKPSVTTPPPTSKPPACPPPTGGGTTSRGRIAFVSTREGNGDIFVLSRGTCAGANVTKTPIAESEPSWELVGERLLFTRGGSVWRANADGSDAKQLTSSGSDRSPVWSPVGARIAFVRDGDIWLMGTDGSNQRRAVDAPEAVSDVTWGPDGEQLAFATTAGPGIWTVRSDGSGLSKVNGSGSSPSWGPDGRIAFASESPPGNLDIYVMAANGSGVTRLTNAPAGDDRPSWSFDGTRIAYETFADGNWEISTMKADGTDVIRVTNHAAVDNDPAW